ncbi:MAG: D-2-hydroxyacid dehydrogenase [Gammaproteobacteria bacterium]
MTTKPTIVLLTAEDEDRYPGLEQVENVATLIHVRDEASLKDALPQADILLVTDFRARMLQKVWPGDHHIDWLHATAAGVDALMFPEVVNSDIRVTNARGVFDRGIAEYVLGAILLFAKDTINNIRYQRRHQWRHRETELIQGSRALVVGAGSIGRKVAGLLRAAGMTVIGTARSARQDDRFDAVYANDKLHDLLPESDYVIITAPLTDDTRGLFDHKAFSSMKPSARLINVGRGPIVVESDLVDALENKIISGAALDVFEQEPLDEQSLLWEMPQVMISAHMAGDFIGWRRALIDQFVENFHNWSEGRELFNVVDKQSGFVSSKV